MPITVDWSLFPKQVRNRNDVVRLSRGMLLHDVSWHWEEDALDYVGKDGQPVFAEHDAERINALCDGLCSLRDDVAEGYCVDMLKLHLELGPASTHAWTPRWSTRHDQLGDWDEYVDWAKQQLH